MKTLQQHRARPQRWLATLTIAVLALGAPLATAAPAFADTALPAVEQVLPEQTPAEQPPAAATPADESRAEEAPAEEAPESWDAVQNAPVSTLSAEAPAPAPAVAATPVVTLSEAPHDGGAVVVRGTGFAAATPGVYLGVGIAGSDGFYSPGLVASETVWISIENIAGSSDAGKTAPMNSDGSFEVTVTVPAVSDAVPSYAVYTSKAHGQGFMDKSQNTATVVSYAAAPPAVVAPVLTLSKSTGLLAEGETVTVTGTGYDPAVPMYLIVCSDVPVEDVNFTFASKCTTGAKLIKPNPSASPNQVKLEEDGSFTTEFLVTDKGASGTAVYTVADHTAMQNRTQDVKVAVSFAPPVPQGPVLTLSKSTGLLAEGETVTVTGTGYDPAVPMYLIVCSDVPVEDVNFTFASKCTTGAKLIKPNPSASPNQVKLEEDGSFTTEFLVTDKGASGTAVYTVADHTAMQNRTQDVKVAVSFAPKVVGPAVTASVASASASSGLSVRLVGSDFGVTKSVYAAIIEKGTESSVTADSGFAVMEYWPEAVVGGVFDKKLVAPTAVLDRSKQYEVLVWRQHSLPNADTIYARADVTPTSGQWDALFPAPQPGAEATTTTLSVDKTAVVEGATVTATAVIAPVTASGTVSFLNGSTVVAKDVAVTGGTATASLKLAKIGTASLTAVFTPAKNALFLTSTSAAVSVAVAAKPVTPPAAQTGELSWGIYGAFRDYITGPIAKGEVALSDGASASGSGYLFAQTGGTVDLQAGKGAADYSGAVRFTGHHGALDVTIGSPTLRLDSKTTATLRVVVNGTRVDFATVNLAAAGTSTDKDKTLFVDAPVTLSEAGAVAFLGNYPAGTVIDPITVAFSTGATEPVETVGTRTALSVDKDTVVVGGSVKLSATVTPASAQGSVIFAANGSQLGAAVRVADGQASADAVLRTVGSIALTARFVPDAGFGASSSAASTVKVTSSVLPPVKPPVITPPTTPVVPPVVAPTVQGGSLSWGLGSVFRNYITGPIAKGSISVGSGATSSGGVFQFGQSGGSFDQGSGTGTADYAGSVRFTGHGGILDLTFANPTLSVTSATSALLSLSVNGGRVDFATVNLGSAARSSLNGATVFSGAPVTLTAAGASAFQGYYSAGEVLDPMTVTIGAAAAAPSGTTGTIATASVNTPAQGAVPASPPATTGITLTPEVLGSIAAGGQISFEADGFQPNETGIRVVIYSTPTVLAENLTADANGVVRWSGTLPATLTGEHTLTVQGSISKGVVITIPERAVVGFCPVEGATLDWGFKQSFLAYISSGIANGGWELAGGTTEADGLFHWADGTGSIDQKSGAGLVSYLGSIRFTGHDGALDTTVANPRIELVSETEGYLVLDVTGTTQQGEPIDGQALRFGQLTLGAGSLEVTEAGITGTDIEAVLTDAGAAAFGTYPAGDALDPISFTLPTADCAVVAAEAESSEAGPSDKTVTAISADVAEQGVSWIVWVLAAVLAAALAVIVVLLAKRRRAGADASAE